MEENKTDLSKILSISGKPGLYKTVAQAKNGVIVESLTDGKRFQAFSHDKVSALSDISVFTQNEDKPLRDVLQAVREKTDNGKAPDPKSDNQKLREFFESILPDYDREKVYISHIKKICAWYNQLHEKNMLDFAAKEEESETSGQPAINADNKEKEIENTGESTSGS